MPIGDIAASLFLSGGLVAMWRSRRDSFWLVTGLFVLGITVVVAVRDGLHLVFLSGQTSAAETIAALLLGSLFWSEALGLPRSLATVLGIGLRSRALTFDGRLLDDRQALVAAVERAQVDGTGRHAALLEGSAEVHRMRHLRPPDRPWALLRDDIADDFEAWFDLLAADASPDRLSDHAEAFAPVMTRWIQMRDQAAQEQRALATPARRRRGQAVWLATFGTVFLIIAIAQLRAFDALDLGVTAPRFWFTIGALAGAAIALTGALVTVIRR
jgi:hypothetical protein